MAGNSRPRRLPMQTSNAVLGRQRSYRLGQREIPPKTTTKIKNKTCEDKSELALSCRNLFSDSSVQGGIYALEQSHMHSISPHKLLQCWTRTHARMQTQHTHIHARTHSHIHACTHAHSRTHTHARTHDRCTEGMQWGCEKEVEGVGWAR